MPDELLSGTSRAVVVSEPGPSPQPLPGVPSGVSTAPEGGEAASTGSMARLIGRVFVENKMAVVGVVIIVVMVLFSFIGPLIYKTDQITPNLLLLNNAPSGQHIFGTDDQGYDLLGRVMKGGQASLEVGLAAAAVATLLGVIWGAVAGFFGGVVDAVMMRIVDVVLSIPGLLLLITLAVILQPGELHPHLHHRRAGLVVSRPPQSEARLSLSERGSTCKQSGSWAAAAGESSCATSSPTPSEPSS